ncbi:MAG TPA: T9SS type A sorting domain-containing protein, partial [Rubricoccaceae bacterium]|nr:T9SS type A sorting domain-containing protein [Rubricoccaceae bacterium]
PSTYLIAVDADDPSREAVSARFRVREPWRLHRVVGPLQRPEYEKIERARHAWSFDQRPENMWPETYWNHRYHYYGNTEVGYDRFVEPVPDVRYDPEFFAGHTASENPTWPSFVRAFGMAGTYASAEPWGLPGFLLHQPNREAADFWDTKTHQFDGYEGACYGLSMAMMAAFQDPERFDAKWLPTSGGSETLASVPLTDEVRDAAHALLAYQWGRLQRNQNELNVGVTPRETLERLRLMFERDDRTRDRFITLRSYYHDGDGSRRYGGHAVVPLGMQRTGEGLYAIGVFDPNTGGVAPEYVFVDSTANAWTYSDSFWEGAEGKGLYLSIEAIYAFDPASTSWPHVFEENAAGPPLAARGGGSEHRSVGIVGRGGAVTSAAGALRYEGGVLTETLPGGFVSFPYTGGPSDPDAYVVPADGGPYRAEAVPRDDGIARVRVEGGPVTATFAQAEAADATRAVVDLLDDGLAVVSGGGGVFTLGATAAAGGAPELRSVRVRDLASADPAGLALTAAPDAATFRLVGADEPTTYDLTVGRAAPGEHRTFHHAAVPLAAGAVHTVRPDWGHLAGGTVTVEVDLDGDGEPDEVLVLEDEGYPVGAEPSRPEGLPSSYALHAAAPNPFAGRTTLRYDLPEAAPVRLVVYDLLGREVAVLVDGEREAGTHAAVLDGRGFAAGVYVVRMTAGGRDFTQRLTLVR